MSGPDQRSLRDVIERAIQEDAPWGDITSDTLVPDSTRGSATLVARESGVFCGSAVVSEVFTSIDNSIVIEQHIEDGKPFAPGDRIATVSGNLRSILRGERVALNLCQHLSGISTLTARFVAAVANTKARIVDTRKTTPLLRDLEKYAVRCGGAHNHRYSLSDAMLVKDNHLATLTNNGVDITTALLRARAAIPHTVTIEVEVDRLDQLDAVLAAEVDVIMLDNFLLDDIKKAVTLINGRALIEASGGVNLQSVSSIAATGVDLISVGALTHSAPNIDIALDIEVQQ